MGGAAGHLNNIWEVTSLTFDDIRDLTQKALTGKLDNSTEKLDGQNLMLTYKDGRVLMARTGKHLRNFGELGIPLENVWGFFGVNTPNNIRNTYQTAIQDFQTLLRVPYANDIFQNGKYWINAEILCEDTENVIYYGINQIRIHNIVEIDKNGKTIESIVGYKLNLLMKAVTNSWDKLEFNIQKTNSITFKPKRRDINVDDFFNTKLDQLEEAFESHNTIEDYMYNEMLKYIVDKCPHIENDNLLVQQFATRWGRKDKAITITTLLKGHDKIIVDWFKTNDKIVDIAYKNALIPFVFYFLQLGVHTLLNVKGLITDSLATTSMNKLKLKYKNAIDIIMDRLEDMDSKTLHKMNLNINYLKGLGGIANAAPTEGIVFTYKDNLLKLTGAFSPLIQLIGYSKYIK